MTTSEIAEVVLRLRDITHDPELYLRTPKASTPGHPAPKPLRSRWLHVPLVRERVEMMVEHIEQGGELPPVVVVGPDYILADGWHRLAAHRLAGRTTIAVEQHPGGRADAIVLAIRRNSIAAPVPLTRAGRDKGIKALLLGEVGR